MTKWVNGLLLALVACGSEGLVCGEYSEEVDGVCVGAAPRPEGPSFEAAIASEGQCARTVPGDGRLDVRLGCADEVCVGRYLRDIDLAMGEAAICAPDPYWGGGERCDWSNGAYARLWDLDGDGRGDRGLPVTNVYVGPTFDGSTEDGLRPGVSGRCFVDVLGVPTDATLAGYGEGWRIDEATWADQLLTIRDSLFYGPQRVDDRVTEIRMSYGEK